MTKDLRSSQIQTSQIISSGSTSTNAKIVVYDISGQDQSNPNQGIIDPTLFNTSSIGTDIFLYVSGTKASAGAFAPTPQISVFGGDLTSSGSIIAKQGLLVSSPALTEPANDFQLNTVAGSDEKNVLGFPYNGRLSARDSVNTAWHNLLALRPHPLNASFNNTLVLGDSGVSASLIVASSGSAIYGIGIDPYSGSKAFVEEFAISSDITDYARNVGSDVFFYVSGTQNTWATSSWDGSPLPPHKVSVFGGDVRVSGSFIGGSGSFITDIFAGDHPFFLTDSFANYNIIGGGKLNEIKAVGEEIFIGNGQSGPTTITASITSSADYNIVGAGTTNKILYSDNSAIIAGQKNTILPMFSTFFGVTTTFPSETSIIGAGYNNVISGTRTSAIVAGVSGTIQSSEASIIGSGINNAIIGANAPVSNSFIGAGSNNGISSSFSSVINGDTNAINGDFSLIAGGVSNSIGSNDIHGLYKTILGGKNNTIDLPDFHSIPLAPPFPSPEYSVILGGARNRINISSSLLYGFDLTGSVDEEHTVQFGSRTISGVDSHPFRFVVSASKGSVFHGGISGSLQMLEDGVTSYLKAGTNVTLTTASNGQVTIGAAGGGGSSLWNDFGNEISVTSSVAIASGVLSASAIGTDVYFYVSGTFGSGSATDKVSVFGGDVRISGTLAVGSGSLYLSDDRVVFSSASLRSVGGTLTFFDDGNLSGKSLTQLANSPAGQAGEANIVTGTDSAIVTGLSGTIDANYSFIGSGELNAIELSKTHSGIVAGYNNILSSSWSIIGAGYQNKTLSNYTFVGSGDTNIINTGGNYSTIIAGSFNTISNFYSAIASGDHNIIDGTNGNGNSFIAAGTSNTITNTNNSSGYSFIGAGDSNAITSVGGIGYSFIGAGEFNTVSGDYSSIVAGSSNTILYNGSFGGPYSFIGGGLSNTINTNGYASAIAAGNNNTLDGNYAFIGSGGGNKNIGDYSGIIVGQSNTITHSQTNAFIGGGKSNFIGGSGGGGFILGDQAILTGINNTISSSGINRTYRSVILGGDHNLIETSSSLLFGSNLTGSAADGPTIQFGSRTISGTDNNPFRFVVSASKGSVFHGGLSGSLTTLEDGSPYLLAGTNITLATGSNGAVTINSTGGGGSSLWSDLGGEASITSSVAISSDGLAASTHGSDVYFYVSGTFGSGSAGDKVSVFGGDVRISGTLAVGTGSVYITEDRITFASSSIRNVGGVLTFFDDVNLTGKSLTELSTGGGGSSTTTGSLLSFGVTDYASTTSVVGSPETIGQIYYDASKYDNEVTLTSILSATTTATTASLKLFNLDDQIFVDIGGSGQTVVSSSGTTPMRITSVNLISATGFNATSGSKYELQAYTSNGANSITIGAAAFEVSGTIVSSNPTRQSIGFYSVTTSTSASAQIVGQSEFIPSENNTTTCTFRSVLSTTTGSNEAFVQLFNITSGALVHIGGAGITTLSTQNTTPTSVNSVNLFGATNFSTGSAVYETRTYTASGSLNITHGSSELICV